MREETFKIYKFDELSPEAQAKALEYYRYSMVEVDWWQTEYHYYIDCLPLESNRVIQPTEIRGFDIERGLLQFRYDVNMQLIHERFREKYPFI